MIRPLRATPGPYPPSASTRGYLTMAVGQRGYLEMAVDMTLSLREHTQLPVAIAVDEPLGAVVRKRYSGVFDEVTIVPPRFLQGRALKYGTAEASPYEETIFLDADCLVLGNLDGVASSLEDHDFAMVGELLDRDVSHNHHGFATHRLMRRFGLDRYLKSNSGLFCFRRSAALEIMEECLRCYVSEARPALRFALLQGCWLGDEIPFGIVGGRRRLGTLPFPAPMYWPLEIEQLDLDRPAKPLLHFLWPVSPQNLDALVGNAAARRLSAGVPGAAGSHWRRKVRALRRMVLRRRVMERLVWT